MVLLTKYNTTRNTINDLLSVLFLYLSFSFCVSRAVVRLWPRLFVVENIVIDLSYLGVRRRLPIHRFAVVRLN